MTRSPIAVAALILAPLFAIVLTGCQTAQSTARAEATRRWNVARARIKAKLAADQLEEGNVAGAAAELAEAERLDPDNPSAVALRARVWLAEGKSSQALERLAQVCLEDRAQAEVEYLKGVALQQQQRWNEALGAFSRACELDNHEVAYVAATAQTWLQLGQPTQALEFLAGHATQFDWTDSFQATLAECHEQLGDWSAAASAWQRVASSPEAASEGRERAAEALYRAGRYEDAIPLLLELVQEAPPGSSVPLHLMLAECYFAVGRPAAARTHLQAVLRGDAEQVSALRMLARSFAEGGDWAAALRVAQQAAAVDGQDPRTLELVAGLAWRAGECDLATSAATRLLTLEPENPVGQRVLQPDH